MLQFRLFITIKASQSLLKATADIYTTVSEVQKCCAVK